MFGCQKLFDNFNMTKEGSIMKGSPSGAVTPVDIDLWMVPQERGDFRDPITFCCII